MKVTLTKYGGLAAGLRQPPVLVESGTLSEEAARELTRLVEAVKAAPPQRALDPGRARDAMSYKVIVEEENGEETEIRGSDTTMTVSFALLLDWLERQRERQR
jgi:hypothetical protein